MEEIQKELQKQLDGLNKRLSAVDKEVSDIMDEMKPYKDRLDVIYSQRFSLKSAIREIGSAIGSVESAMDRESDGGRINVGNGAKPPEHIVDLGREEDDLEFYVTDSTGKEYDVEVIEDGNYLRFKISE